MKFFIISILSLAAAFGQVPVDDYDYDGAVTDEYGDVIVDPTPGVTTTAPITPAPTSPAPTTPAPLTTAPSCLRAGTMCAVSSDCCSGVCNLIGNGVALCMGRRPGGHHHRPGRFPGRPGRPGWRPGRYPGGRRPWGGRDRW